MQLTLDSIAQVLLTDDLLGAERAGLNALEIERAIAGQPAITERRHGGSDGQPRLNLEVTHVAGALQPDGRRKIYVFGIDIKARKRAEESLIVARDEAERANRAKSQLLSNMSHELRTRLKQVLLNLLANAIKYNAAGGAVDVASSALADKVRVTVRDSGPGLSRADQAHLFQPFERLAAGRTEIEGTGIGLALSHRLVHAMGGTIGVDSAPGHGSSFWVELPRSDALPVPQSAAVPAAPQPAASLADIRPHSVLYIEDNRVNAIVMQAMLARLPGLRCTVAALPLQGLALAHSERPDLILLDIQMPAAMASRCCGACAPATRRAPSPSLPSAPTQCRPTSRPASVPASRPTSPSRSNSNPCWPPYSACCGPARRSKAGTTPWHHCTSAR